MKDFAIMRFQVIMMGGAVILLCILCLVVAEKQNDNFLLLCNKSHTLQNLQIGAHGNISFLSSRDDATSQTCRVFMKACPRCRIKLAIMNLQLPPCNEPEPVTTTGCIHQCDHINIFEPSYRESSLRNYFSSNSSDISYESLSSSVTIKLCSSGKQIKRAFTIQFDVLEKKNIISGSYSENKKGLIASPNFPHGYAVGSEVYVYIFRSKDADGCILLVMDDWDLASTSKVQFYSDENETSLISSHSGSTQRPVVTSNGSLLYMKFEPGYGLSYRIHNMGFTASYWFINSTNWPGKPVTDCGGYFKYDRGGEIRFKGETQRLGHHYDCIWVITKSSAYEKVQIRINKLHLLTETGRNISLKLRSGLTSMSPLIGEISDYNFSANQEVAFSSDNGFYIRLSGDVVSSDDISLIFTSFTPETSGSCVRSGDFRCRNHKCIDRNLLCDKMDHCGDGTDEGAVCRDSVVIPTQVRTYSRLCRAHEFSCLDGKRCLPQSAVCDKWLDCKDGSDEYFCTRGKTTINPLTTTELDCGPKMWKCASGDECVFSWQKCDEYPHCVDHSDERNCTPRGSQPVGMTPPWNVLAPVGLSICIALFICVIIFCIRSHYKELNEHHPRGHCGVTTVSGVVRRRDHRCRSVCSHTNSASPLTLSPNSDMTFTLTSPPSYEEALRLSADNGMFNAAFASSDSDMRSMCPPPAYTPSPTETTGPQVFHNLPSPVITTNSENVEERSASADVNDSLSSPCHSATSREETETLLPSTQCCPDEASLYSFSDHDNSPPSPSHSVSSQEETSVLLDSPVQQNYCDSNDRLNCNLRTNRPRSRTLANDELYTIVPTDDNGNTVADMLPQSPVKHSSITDQNTFLSSSECDVDNIEIICATEQVGDLNQNFKRNLDVKSDALVKQGGSMPNLLNTKDFSIKNVNTKSNINKNHDIVSCDIQVDKASSGVGNAELKGLKLELKKCHEDIISNDEIKPSIHDKTPQDGCHKRSRSLGYLIKPLPAVADRQSDLTSQTFNASATDNECSLQRNRTSLTHANSMPNICLSKSRNYQDFYLVEFDEKDVTHKRKESDDTFRTSDPDNGPKLTLQKSDKNVDSNNMLEKISFFPVYRYDNSPKCGRRKDKERIKPINLRCFGETDISPKIFTIEATEV